MGIFSELRRRHVFRVAGAYLLLAWVVLQVTDTLISVLELPGGIGRVVFYILVVGFPLAILASWVFEITPEGIKRDSDTDHLPVRSTSTGRAVDFVIIAALTIVIGFLAWERITPDGHERQSIAVLPIRSIDGNETSVLFATGMHDTLLAELATVADLDVIARQSVMEFADSRLSIGEIAVLLGVTHIVDASVQKVGEQLRVAAQLIEVESDKHLWGNTYDEAIGFDNFFDVQSEIADKISVSLETTLLPVKGIGSRNEDAVRDYLAAINTWFETYALYPGVETGLKSAVEKDPEFALAWARLADIYQQKYWFLPDHDHARDQAEEALARARALQPDLPELHLVQAKIRYHGYRDYEGALAELKLAEDAMPGAAEVFLWRGFVLRRMRELPRALVAFERAMELDPRDTGTVYAYGLTLLMARRYQEAEAHFEQAIARFPGSESLRLQQASVSQYRDGDVSQRIAALEASLKGPAKDPADLMDTKLGLVEAYWIDGQIDLALKHVLDIGPAGDPTGDNSSRLEVAFVLQAAGREDEARLLFEQEANDLAGMLDSGPNDVFLLNDASRVAMAMGDRELATRYANRIIEVEKDIEKHGRPVPAFETEDLPLLYGSTLCQIGELDAAYDAFRKVLKRTTPYTPASLVNEWPPCREQFEGTPQYEALLEEFGHLSEG